MIYPRAINLVYKCLETRRAFAACSGLRNAQMS